MSGPPPLLQPTPRPPRHGFDLTPASSTSSRQPSPPPSLSRSQSLSQSQSQNHIHVPSTSDQPPSRTRSILNLTSSTLFGIYSSTPPNSKNGYDEDDPSTRTPDTPWGTGAMTPSSPSSPRASIDAGRRNEDAVTHRRKESSFELVVRVIARSVLLFVAGVAYGMIVTRLHDHPQVAPVQIGGIDRSGRGYTTFWGCAGVVLGTALPFADWVWEESHGTRDAKGKCKMQPGGETRRRREADDWSPVFRSIGAFVGIVFAIRRLPWESILQASLTLALVNPFLWYLIDRSKPGFALSSFVGIAGTFVLLAVTPDMVPQPSGIPSSRKPGARTSIQDSLPHETIGAWTWIASVLFCSCVCFGALGRRLAPGRAGTRIG